MGSSEAPPRNGAHLDSGLSQELKAKTPMESETTVKVLREIGELEEIREAWESWPGNRDSQMDPFVSFLRSNPGSVRPHVIVVYGGGVPSAILVGRIDRGPFTSRLGYMRVSRQAQKMVFVYGALLGNPSRETCELMLDEILKALSRGEADFAFMNFLREGSDLWQFAMNRPGLLSRDYVRITQPHFAAKLFPTVEEYYQSLPAESKGFNKARHKKLMKDFAGRVEIRCFRDPAEVDLMAQDVEQVAKTSYQRGLGVGFVDTEEMREGLRLMAARGWLRGYVLYLGDRPCAFWVGDINQGTFGSDYIGFDSEFGKYSPGMFLTTKVIEGFCCDDGERVSDIDFGPGNAQYKEILSNQRWHETALHIFAPSLKGISLNLTRTVVAGADQAIKKVLASTGLLQKIKKKLRERARPKNGRSDMEIIRGTRTS
jgi:Acetyltransferase (GNAT) domain